VKCIYCNEEKEDNEFSLEHIFPSALGGKAINNHIFKTRSVCKRCNNLSGLYVDSAFVKNFFATSCSLFPKFIGYYDFEKPSYIPFSYLGFIEYIDHPHFKFCEKWIWIDGSMVYHFHNNSNDDFDTIAGGDPRKRKNVGAGEVYLVGITNNPFWLNHLIYSYFKQFKKSKSFFVNYTFQNNKKSSVSQIQRNICEEIYKFHRTNKEQKHIFKINKFFNIRFQAKLALGLGYSLFGEKYTQSSEAKNIREVFWNKDFNELDELKPEMLQFFSEGKCNLLNYSQFTSISGCHNLYFMIDNDTLIFYADLYGEGFLPLSTVITKNLNNYTHDLIKKYPNGWGYILVPQRDLFFGEYHISEILAYNMGDKSYLPELIELEKKYQKLEDLPPFIIDN
jgi:hypothetical protein